MIKFEVGQTYSTRSVCDHNCIIRAEIVARTASTVKAKVRDEVKTFRVKANFNNSAEMFMPWGRGSMMPILEATDTKKLVPDWEAKP